MDQSDLQVPMSPEPFLSTIVDLSTKLTRATVFIESVLANACADPDTVYDIRIEAQAVLRLIS
jgi:hypothetical protein